MSSSSPPPDTSGSDSSSAASGTANSNFTLLYIIIAVLVGVLLYLAVGYGRLVLSEWRQRLHAPGDGGVRPASSRHGLSVDDIGALPTFTYRAPPTPSPPQSKRSKGRAAVECVVCLQELEDGDVVRMLPACRHFFHGSCIDAWLCAHSSCPVCRAYPQAPERAQLALSPPLPQLSPCGGVSSPERPVASFGIRQAQSPPLMSNSTSPITAGDYMLSRSPSQTLGRMVDERISSSPEMTEIVVVRSIDIITITVQIK